MRETGGTWSVGWLAHPPHDAVGGVAAAAELPGAVLVAQASELAERDRVVAVAATQATGAVSKVGVPPGLWALVADGRAVRCEPMPLGPPGRTTAVPLTTLLEGCWAPGRVLALVATVWRWSWPDDTPDVVRRAARAADHPRRVAEQLTCCVSRDGRAFAFADAAGRPRVGATGAGVAGPLNALRCALGLGARLPWPAAELLGMLWAAATVGLCDAHGTDDARLVVAADPARRLLAGRAPDADAVDVSPGAGDWLSTEEVLAAEGAPPEAWVAMCAGDASLADVFPSPLDVWWGPWGMCSALVDATWDASELTSTLRVTHPSSGLLLHQLLVDRAWLTPGT